MCATKRLPKKSKKNRPPKQIENKSQKCEQFSYRGYISLCPTTNERIFFDAPADCYDIHAFPQAP